MFIDPDPRTTKKNAGPKSFVPPPGELSARDRERLERRGGRNDRRRGGEGSSSGGEASIVTVKVQQPTVRLVQPSISEPTPEEDDGDDDETQRGEQEEEPQVQAQQRQHHHHHRQQQQQQQQHHHSHSNQRSNSNTNQAQPWPTSRARELAMELELAMGLERGRGRSRDRDRDRDRVTSHPAHATSASSRTLGVSPSRAAANAGGGSPELAETSTSTLSASSSQHTLNDAAWNRRSTSSTIDGSGWASSCSTLQHSDSDLLGRKSARSFGSLLATTLRDSPTPYEHDERDDDGDDLPLHPHPQPPPPAHLRRIQDPDPPRQLLAGLGPGHALEPLHEASPERLGTIRAVQASNTSSSASQSSPDTSPASPGAAWGPPSSSPPRPLSAPPDSPGDASSSSSPSSLPRTARRAFSTGSLRTLPSISDLGDPDSSPIIQRFPSTSTARHSETTPVPWSSPNFIAYSSGTFGPETARRPISYTEALRGAVSIESINSRLHRYSILRSENGGSITSQRSWASSESNDTLPPLHVPKRRLRHKPASSSLASQASQEASASPDDTMEPEEVDTEPYPRRPFSNHLSTIVSESDSRAASQHLSHWSYGSGVLTLGSYDDTGSVPLSPARALDQPPRRRGSAPVLSVASSLQTPVTRGTSCDDGELALGVYREASAVPQPLFKSHQGPSIVESGPAKTTRKYDGPVPPVPPIPTTADSDEHYDTLSELTRPSLHQKRSGYSLRGDRTNTTNTPNHSRQQSEISCSGSEGTGTFPTWARHFYSGTAVLSSKLSFSSLSTDRARRDPQASGHRRQGSAWTDRSITSRLGQTYSNVEDASPSSSHFLPAIFRPRTRRREANLSQSSNRVRKSQRSNRSRLSPRCSQDTNTDSMAINPEIRPPSEANGIEGERLPSGQPRWGLLRDPDDPRVGPRGKPLRKYSKQNQWNDMEFPRPMTKDRLSDFHLHEPHLAPSKRTSQRRLSFWQAPSFTESLNTLLHSRCNRQILLFTLGFVFPPFWMLGAILPLPHRPPTETEVEKALQGGEDDVEAAMMRHEAADAERRLRDEKLFLKAKWWRSLNMIMSFIGLLVIAAVVALVVIATR